MNRPRATTPKPATAWGIAFVVVALIVMVVFAVIMAFACGSLWGEKIHFWAWVATGAISAVPLGSWVVFHWVQRWGWLYGRFDARNDGWPTSLCLCVLGAALTSIQVLSGWHEESGFPHLWANRWMAALVSWQFAALGAAWAWVEGIRVGLRWLPEHYRPRPVLAYAKTRAVTLSHGIVERLLFTLVAIPVLRDPADSIAVSVLVAAAALYVAMRARCRDVQEPTLSVFALWGMLVSVGLGIFGGWVFWAAGQ